MKEIMPKIIMVMSVVSVMNSCSSLAPDQPAGAIKDLKDTATYVYIGEVNLIGPSGKRDLTGKIQDTVRIWRDGEQFTVRQSGVRITPQRDGSMNKIPLESVKFTAGYDDKQRRLADSRVSAGVQLDGDSLFFMEEPAKIYKRWYQ